MRDAEWLRFDYDGEPRLVEPYRLLSWQRRWHLVARDPDDGTWATYRVDRIEPRHRTHRRFDPSQLPGGDYTAFAMRAIAAGGWNVHARLRIESSAEEVLARINPAVGVVEPIDEHHCVLVTGADSLDTVAVYRHAHDGLHRRIASRAPPPAPAAVGAVCAGGGGVGGQGRMTAGKRVLRDLPACKGIEHRWSDRQAWLESELTQSASTHRLGTSRTRVNSYAPSRRAWTCCRMPPN